MSPRPRGARAPLPARVLFLARVLPLAAVLVACGTPDDDAPGDAARPSGAVAEDRSSAADAHAPVPGGVVVVDGIEAREAWVRVAIVPEADASGRGGEAAPRVNSAAYVTLRNGGDQADALVTVATSAADTAELHSVSMQDGIMRMRPVAAVELPAGEVVALEPGGYHVMLVGLHRPLTEGDSVGLTFRLRSGRTLELRAPVRRAPRR